MEDNKKMKNLLPKDLLKEVENECSDDLSASFSDENKEIFKFRQDGVTDKNEVNGTYIMYDFYPKVCNKIKSRGITSINDLFSK